MSSQYYKVTAYVGTPHRNAVEVTIPLVGPAGPAGPAGTGLETLTAPGDTLYQGQSTGERLPIGSAGQVLKVVNGFPAWAAESGAVTSVNGETGVVVLDAADVGAVGTDDTISGDKLNIVSSYGDGPVYVQSFSEGGGGVNGVYWPTGGTINSKPVYKLNRTYGMFFENARWHIYENSPVTQNIVASSDDNNTAYPHQSAWSGDVDPLRASDFGNSAAQQFQFVGDILRVPTTNTANLPLKTGTNGVIEAGSFGTAAGSFCAGDDARLSDARTPSSTLAHKASHATGGTDALSPADIGAATTSHTHAAADVTSGTLDVARLPVGTGSTQVAAGNHTHVVADVTGAAASGSITTSGLTQATARILGRTTASAGAVEEIQIGSGLSLSAGQLSATGGSGVTAVGTTLADILSVSGSDLVADDLAADKLYGWDDSESKAIGFVIGSGLSVSGDTLSATASGGSKTYAVFTAEHNQPTATAFATLDTRNSIAVLDFDDATDESAVFVSIIPEAADVSSGLIVSLRWMATTATSGDVRWSVAWEKSNTDLDSDSFDTATAATAAANGTSGIVTVTNITCTNIDSLAAGDLFRLRVQRVGGDGADTMTGDAEILAVSIESAA
jgi:hypothetical protein